MGEVKILGGALKKKEVQESYNEIGGRLYDLRYKEEQERKFTAVLNHVSLSQDDLILDLGCGTGLLLKKISKCVGFVLGLDLSQGLLSWACSKLKGGQNTALLLSDAEHLPFKEASFDKLFAITILQNIPNPRETLSEVVRVTKPEAVIVLSGLKKSYRRWAFKALINSVGLRTKKFVEEDLKDFVVICEKNL